jgi:hypothetical protein
MRLSSQLAEDTANGRKWESHHDDHMLYFDVEDFKCKFINLTEPVSKKIDYYFDISAPQFLVDAKKKTGQTSWSDWLSKEATLPELVNVAEWHNHVLGEQATDPAIQSTIESEKSGFMTAATKLYEEGVITRPPKDTKKLDVAVIDIFDKIIVSMGANAYFEPHIDNRLNIIQGKGRTVEDRRGDSIDQIHYSLQHELTHWGIGAPNRTSGGPLSARWIDEALTEEVTCMLGSRSNRPLVYIVERKLLEVVLSGASSEDSVPTTPSKLATRAYSGDVDSVDELSKIVDKIWGINHMLEKVNKLVIQAEQESNRNGVSNIRTFLGLITILTGNRSQLEELLRTVD